MQSARQFHCCATVGGRIFANGGKDLLVLHLMNSINNSE